MIYYLISCYNTKHILSIRILSFNLLQTVVVEVQKGGFNKSISIRHLILTGASVLFSTGCSGFRLPFISFIGNTLFLRSCFESLTHCPICAKTPLIYINWNSLSSWQKKEKKKQNVDHFDHDESYCLFMILMQYWIYWPTGNWYMYYPLLFCFINLIIHRWLKKCWFPQSFNFLVNPFF